MTAYRHGREETIRVLRERDHTSRSSELERYGECCWSAMAGRTVQANNLPGGVAAKLMLALPGRPKDMLRARVEEVRVGRERCRSGARVSRDRESDFC